MLELGNSAARLEPFLLMSKSAKGAAAAKLVQDVTSAPGVFTFVELLDLPNIQELSSSPQHAPFFSLLQLFSFKTYEDFSRHQDSYPPLNVAQVSKLKHLTLASFAMQQRVLPYATLQSALELPSIRALEDVIIDAIYQNIIRGKLDQKQQHFRVEWVMGRDLAPGAIEGLLKSLQEWSNITSTLLTQLDHTILSVQSSHAVQTVALENHNLMQQKTLNDVIQTSSQPAPRSRRVFAAPPNYSTTEDRMDVDEPLSGTWGDAARKKKVGQETTQLRVTRKRNRF